MYKMTPRMLQSLRRDLETYHRLFDGGRCSGWQLEELIVKAIKSDTQANHHVLWSEAGHDDVADITVHVNSVSYQIQVKSGQIIQQNLKLSGHRLGRYEGNLSKITNYLNSKSAHLLSIPYVKVDDRSGRRHEYTVCYIDIKYLQGITPDGWEKPGASYIQLNQYEVEFRLSPSMSWQIWWKIPLELIELSETFVIG